ncbi:MAG: tetratricopeptide repeat protein, partial [bacterium]
RAYYNRAVTYLLEEDYERAIADLTQAIKIKSDYADAYYSRAVAYYGAKEYVNAWADIRRLQNLGYQVNPEFIRALQKQYNP